MKTKILAIMVLAFMILPATAEANSPTLRFSIANYDPMPAQPGQFVDVSINVQNIGSGDARDIQVKYLESPYFELVNPDQEVREIAVLGANKDYVLRYRFRVADDVVEGRNNLRFEHSMKSQPGVSSTINLGINVKSTETPISVSSVNLSPDPVEPGQRSTLKIAVTNPSTSSNLRDVSVRLQLAIQEGQNMISLPFAPVDSTNKKSINRIRPGQTTEFLFELVTYPDAESKIYKVPVTFSYYDDVGNMYEDTSFVSINVNSEPDLYAIIESIGVNKNIKRGEVIFDIVNQGISDIKLLTVKLEDTSYFEVTSSSNKEYLGNIDSDDFKSARFSIKVENEVEEITFPLKLTFRDALNNEFTETIQVTHTLRDQAEECCNGYLNIIIILVVVGLIGYWYYRKKQKRKKLLKEDDDD